MKNDAMTSLRLPHDLMHDLDVVVRELEGQPEYAALRVTRGTVIRMAVIEFLARRNDARRSRIRYGSDLDLAEFESSH